jgi:hypothetical protein
MKAKGLKMILIQGFSSWMGSYIIKGYFIFQMVHVDFKFTSPVMTFLLQDILASTKPWSLYHMISGGHKCGKPLRIMLRHTCDICSCSKVPRYHPYMLLRPLPIPKKPWFSICMDFITDLPSSKAFDSIFVVRIVCAPARPPALPVRPLHLPDKEISSIFEHI